MQSEYLVMLSIMLVGVIAKNYTVAAACAILFVIRLAQADRVMEVLENHGLTAGIIILTVGVLAPVAAGKIQPAQIKEAFLSPAGILAIAVGALVAYFAGEGVFLLKNDPLIIAAIIIGTIIGVALFRGVAVGPLIAAGITAVLHKIFTTLQ